MAANDSDNGIVPANGRSRPVEADLVMAKFCLVTAPSAVTLPGAYLKSVGKAGGNVVVRET
ncbi:UNVERIFIED_CONTAM: hypothetical protein NY603_18280, partial [Bacteroidetes bacterium 56_B9]